MRAERHRGTCTAAPVGADSRNARCGSRSARGRDARRSIRGRRRHRTVDDLTVVERESGRVRPIGDTHRDRRAGVRIGYPDRQRHVPQRRDGDGDEEGHRWRGELHHDVSGEYEDLLRDLQRGRDVRGRARVHRWSRSSTRRRPRRRSSRARTRPASATPSRSRRRSQPRRRATVRRRRGRSSSTTAPRCLRRARRPSGSRATRPRLRCRWGRTRSPPSSTGVPAISPARAGSSTRS